MSGKTYPAIIKDALVTDKQYKDWYQQSLDDPQVFWAEQAKKYVTWSKEWDTVLSGSFEKLDVKWFAGGKLNVSANCLDRHLEKHGDKIAIIWEGDDPDQSLNITYRELHQKVCQFANVLKRHDIQKGDRVCLYMPMIPEAAIAMLACARIGAIHSVVFGGFSAESLKTRINDADCKLVITANDSVRGGKVFPLKENVNKALQDCPHVKSVIVVVRDAHSMSSSPRTDTKPEWDDKRDHWYHEEMDKVDSDCPAVEMDAMDPLFILYTSGSTGKPKGILHGTGGYLLYASMTHKLVFNCKDDDIYWCTADVGWVTGHSYIVYGPLSNASTIVMFEGIPTYPDASRFWQVVDKHQVTIFYTAPTAVRALRREGDEYVTKTKRTSLRILGSVGEPINPEAWEWYYNVVGNKRCPIVDTWWQTETGGIMITPLPGATPLKPGAASWPFFGVEVDIVDDDCQSVKDGTMGRLIIKRPWPGMLQTVYRNHDRFVETYFKDVPGAYLSGDLATRDNDGYIWIAGRSDDVINISGHRIGTGEVESALILHPSVSETAVVGKNDEIKGETLYAYVTLRAGHAPSDALKKALCDTVREAIGAIAVPKDIQWVKALPKTRSGKIMRRILRKIANGQTDELGDLSTLANPEVVDELK